MKNIKYIVGVVVAIAGLAFGYFFFMGTSANANPDYICIKNVDRTCQIDESKCGEWDKETGTRTCQGTRVTQVAYYHTRTTCEKGYGDGVHTSTADSVHYTKADAAHVTGIRGGGYTGGASGRKSKDFNYATENCTVQQVDKNRPAGEVEQVN